MDVLFLLPNVLYLLVTIVISLIVANSLKETKFFSSSIVDSKKIVVAVKVLAVVCMAIVLYILFNEYTKLFS